MKRASGFTVIELVVVVALIGFASVLFFIQKNNIEVASRDEQRKTAINAMYYALEEVYHKQNEAYPRTLSSETLPSVDPDLFTDPRGTTVNQTTVAIDETELAVQPDYIYEGTNCEGDTCKGYTLRATLEAEEPFERTNRTNDS